MSPPATRQGVGAETNAHLNSMRALKNFSRFLRELWAFAREHKAWWIVPVVLLLLLVAVFVVGVSSISPFIYSLF